MSDVTHRVSPQPGDTEASAGRTLHLGKLTWAEARRRQHPELVLIVPVGATEQHGPHLPLSTDTDIAVALAERLAHTRPHTVLAPAIAYGSSGEHQSFAGTISVGPRAIEVLLIELVRSASVTFDHVVFLSTHGGNAEAVARAATRLHDEGRRVLPWTPRWDGDAHAGRTETSIMLALHPESVRVQRAAAGNTAPLVELLPAMRSSGVSAVSPNGILGDPAGATASEGHRLLASAVDALARAIAHRMVAL